MKHAKRLSALEQARGPAKLPAWLNPVFIDSLDRIYGEPGDTSQPMTWGDCQAALDRVYGGNDEAQ
jgi:hypothetical protein